MPTPNDRIYFSSDLSERERACFETGIKLGALYHILSGIPIRNNERIIASLEKGIESAISCQPYVKSVRIHLDREKISGTKESEYDYDEINGKMIRAEVVIEYKSIHVVAKVEWVDQLEYPLMFIEKIHEK
ncbi:MAG: dihydroneopterin aldolase family protein [Promethearchaeota archaeon]